MKEAFRNAIILDPEKNKHYIGDIIIEKNRILDIGPNVYKNEKPKNYINTTDCKGLYACPGLIDMRVSIGEPGEEHKENIKSGSKAALAGGITTIVCLPNTNPVIDNVSVAEYVQNRAKKESKINLYTYGSITKNFDGQNLSEMGLLTKAGVKGFTDATQSVDNSAVFKRALEYSKAFDALIIQFPEDRNLAKHGVMNEGEISTRLGLPGIPTLAEVMVIERDLRLVELTGAKYHVSCISTADAVDAIRKAKQKGLKITCDTSPQYFTLNELAIDDYKTFAKLSPPLRSEKDRVAVTNGLKDGTIDAIQSDHCPQDEDNKRLPFAHAKEGIIGLETLLPLSLELFHNKTLSLIDVIKKLTKNPASILNLNHGTLKKGAKADILIFDPNKPFVIDVKKFRSTSKNSPFNKKPSQGKVIKTICNGEVSYAA